MGGEQHSGDIFVSALRGCKRSGDKARVHRLDDLIKVCLAIGAVAELDQSAEIQFGGESVLDLLVV